MSISNLLRLIVLTAFSLMVAIIPADAQTCRVRVSVSSNGAQCMYREVYEYDYVWEKPSFPGGDDKLISFINKHRKYPKKAYKAGIQGKVMCSFIVNTTGEVSDVQVYKGVEQTLNEEAVRIFTLMPKWIPGRMNGVPVPVRVIRAVPFRR